MAKNKTQKNEKRTGAGLWLGGRFSSPFFVTGEGEPYRPLMDVWMELPSRMVVGQRLSDPREELMALMAEDMGTAGPACP